MSEKKTPKILIVDDNPKNMFDMEQLLKPLDLDVFKAKSGNEALSLISGHDFVMVISDVQTLKMESVETSSLMHEFNGDGRCIPIIFLTAIAKENQHLFKGYEKGVVDYIFKPVDPDILVNKVKLFLHLDIKQRELKIALEELKKVNENYCEEIRLKEQVMERLDEYSNNLEKIVFERTSQLHKINESLMSEIAERKDIEVILKKTTNSLEIKTRELEKSNLELKEKTLQLVQSAKMSALGELTAGIAHELNQPLNAIGIIAQSIIQDIKKNRFDQESLKDDLNDVVMQVKKMGEIINHMRIYTRSTVGNLNENIDINQLINDSFKFLGQQLKAHNIEVIKELCPDLPRVNGNPIRLEQVLLNFISNARDALENNGKKMKNIKIRTYKYSDSYVMIEVADNGNGIPEEIKEKIFEPFFTTKAEGKGTGLGLSISNQIIKEHNGRIELDNKTGEGLTLKVILPAIID